MPSGTGLFDLDLQPNLNLCLNLQTNPKSTGPPPSTALPQSPSTHLLHDGLQRARPMRKRAAYAEEVGLGHRPPQVVGGQQGVHDVEALDSECLALV